MKALGIYFFAFILAANSMLTFADSEHQHHGHSDDLLLLLQAKIKLGKLQANSSKLGQSDNLKQQRKILSTAMKRLTRYVGISRGNYPNDMLFQQSLDNRAAMLADFTKLLSTYHIQLDQTSLNETDASQHTEHQH